MKLRKHIIVLCLALFLRVMLDILGYHHSIASTIAIMYYLFCYLSQQITDLRLEILYNE